MVAKMNENDEIIQGNDWTSMFGSITDTLTNAFVAVKDATKASPNGNVKPASPNPSPGLFGSFPQTQVNTQGNATSILGTLGLGNIAGGGAGLLLILVAILFFLRR